MDVIIILSSLNPGTFEDCTFMFKYQPNIFLIEDKISIKGKNLSTNKISSSEILVLIF